VASENIGNIYITQIPGYEDAADIQAALRLYHYGSTTAPSVNEIGVTNGIIANSIAGHLKGLDDRVDFIETDPARSSYSATQPSGDALTNGYIWVDSTTSIGNVPTYGTSTYSATAPSTDLVVGALWVDSDSSPLKMYVWSGTEWRVIGE
jgi:hypothetical protein